MLSSDLNILVEDNGQGILEVEQEKIFDVYFRGANASDALGDGIGLYVVKENLEKIGGEIEVVSEPGKGSRFTVRLPLYRRPK